MSEVIDNTKNKQVIINVFPKAISLYNTNFFIKINLPDTIADNYIDVYITEWIMFNTHALSCGKWKISDDNKISFNSMQKAHFEKDNHGNPFEVTIPNHILQMINKNPEDTLLNWLMQYFECPIYEIIDDQSDLEENHHATTISNPYASKKNRRHRRARTSDL